MGGRRAYNTLSENRYGRDWNGSIFGSSNQKCIWEFPVLNETNLSTVRSQVVELWQFENFYRVSLKTISTLNYMPFFHPDTHSYASCYLYHHYYRYLGIFLQCGKNLKISCVAKWYTLRQVNDPWVTHLAKALLAFQTRVRNFRKNWILWERLQKVWKGSALPPPLHLSLTVPVVWIVRSRMLRHGRSAFSFVLFLISTLKTRESLCTDEMKLLFISHISYTAQPLRRELQLHLLEFLKQTKFF